MVSALKLPVIVNGDSVSSVASANTEGPIPPKIAEQKLARQNKLKAKITLMLAILNEHLLKFHACKDAKSLWKAIKNKFGGNKELKKMQKTILKQNYENFEDTNLKLLRSLPPAWNNIALIMRNKSDQDTLCIDDLYNNLKLDNEDLEQINTDDLKEMDLKWQVAMFTMRVKRFIKRTGRKLDLNGKETVGFDKTKVECYNYNRRGHFARECKELRNQGNRNKDAPTRNEPVDTSTINALVVQPGISGYDWSFQAEEELINFALMAYTSQSSSNKTGLGYDGHANESEVLNNVVDSCESNGDDNQINDRFKKGNPQYALHNQGIFDSGCSRHMIGNKSYLIDYQKLDGGFVAFGGNAKGGKITRKCKTRIGKLDLEDVYFVKELKFNLFSVSQMCDKKISVLFTATEYVILSPDFKLLDESKVLLKATLDESNLRHKRLGHINFKTMNKLVRRNLVRGIENQMDHKVKTIRCDNGTEFNNRIMNEFCEMKGFRKEFSVARTPQQNAVAKRKNRTLIEAARTMLADSKFTKVPRKENRVQDPAKEGDKNDQEKDLRYQEEPLRKQFELESERLFGQREAANTNSTNRLNIVGSPVNAVSSFFTTVDPGRERAQRNKFESMFGQDKDDNGNMIFTHVSAVGSTYVYLGGSIPVNASCNTRKNVSQRKYVVDQWWVDVTAAVAAAWWWGSAVVMMEMEDDDGGKRDVPDLVDRW
uniref:Integrase catalytic domain-containing protein n=1 Tax=Tanacetum cinerariifolium TaxID=118510 RepID=A0A6L2KBX8_TANCI|nr:hypothetical protein [Tanacetum cinerariifolium]